MSRLDRRTGGCLARTTGLSTALAVLLAGVIAVGTQGCAALPALSIIPSVISLAHEFSSTKSGEDDADTQYPDTTLADADESSPPAKLTPENVCQMIAIVRPDLVVVELRKSTAGAPEYRELRLLNSTDDPRWTPIVDADTGPKGWRPAVNFLKMDFNPPLTDAFPDNGSCYLAYAPTAVASNSPSEEAELKSAFGAEAGVFSWGGRVYRYRVARSLPCLSPNS
jgi:hypothetical protein